MGKSLVLIGFMGTGKTTVGQAIAEKLGIPQLDLDHYIVEKEKREISVIFAAEGEEYFRDVETDCLEEVLQSNISRVITTGGGVVLRPQNRALILQHGLCISLTAQPETIIGRVKNDQSRPLLQDGVEERVHTLLKAREGLYDFAPIQLATDGKSVGEIMKDLWDHPAFQQFMENRMGE